MTFQQLLLARRGPDWIPPHRLVGLDPGETTGVALALDGQLTYFDHIVTKENAFEEMASLLLHLQPTHIICEDYLVYGHKTDAHSWSALHTPKLIGGISMWAYLKSTPLYFQTAATAKPFCNPTKLADWGMWPSNRRHAADAIKHLLYFLLFGKEI